MKKLSSYNYLYINDLCISQNYFENLSRIMGIKLLYLASNIAEKRVRHTGFGVRTNKE